MIYSEKRSELVKALMKARELMSSTAANNTVNNHLKNRYANLESFLDTIRPSLESNHLMIQQAWIEGQDANYLYLKTEVMHISGEFVHFTSPFPIVKKDAHGVGSAITYARRYAIASFFGIAQADDDGNASRATYKDAIRALEGAKDMEELTKLYTAAKHPSKFGNDKSELAVITDRYNKLKADMMNSGEGFKPAEKPQPAKGVDESLPPGEADPQPANDQPGDFDDFK